MIDAQLVARLREISGAGMMDAKRALEEANGDENRAMDILRKKGVLKAAKKSDRVAAEGLVFSYVHINGKVGVLLELNCETDFVARNTDFQNLGKDIALHIAAMDPLYVRREDVPLEILEKERQMACAELAEQKKPTEIIEKIVAGKLEKYLGEICLLEQPFMKDEAMKILDLLNAATAKLGEKFEVRRFVRYTINPGKTC